MSCNDEIKQSVEKIRLEDGRHAERHVTDDGETRVVELHAEPKRDKLLEKRIVEKRRNVVCERTIESIHPDTGEVIEQLVESIDPPESRMQLVKHIARESDKVSAMAVEEDCSVTRQDLIDAVVSAVRAIKDHDEVEAPAPAPQPKAMFKAQAQPAPQQVSAYQELVGERVLQSQQKTPVMNLTLLMVIAAQVAALAYIMFIM